MIGIDATTVICDLLDRGHEVVFRATGDSMYPLVRSGDSLHVEPLAKRGARLGDVVLAQADRGLTAHRIVAIRRDVVVIRGDNAPEADKPLPPSQILGRVAWLERDGRRLRVWRLVPPVPQLIRLTRTLKQRLSPA